MQSLTGLNSVFLLDQMLNQGSRTQSAQLFTYSQRDKYWIHTFLNGIRTMWNAISLVQDLNFCAVSITYDNKYYTTVIFS